MFWEKAASALNGKFKSLIYGLIETRYGSGGPKSTEYCETVGRREKERKKDERSGAELEWKSSAYQVPLSKTGRKLVTGSHHGAIRTKRGKERTWWKRRRLIGSRGSGRLKHAKVDAHYQAQVTMASRWPPMFGGEGPQLFLHLRSESRANGGKHYFHSAGDGGLA
jgi:hypothetical protein